MKRLTAEIDVEVTIRVWNAKDRSKPTKWRRTVPERAPHRAVSYREGPQNEPKMAQNIRGRAHIGCLKGATLAKARVMIIGRLGARYPGRIGPRRTPKCVVW